MSIGLCLLLLSCATPYKPDITKTSSPLGTSVFTPDSATIAANYEIPEWFRDAKFGIFIHWGVYAVPAYHNEWYPREMYVKGSKVYKHHIDTYGPQDEHGYKDFIPMFKAENFDPDAWVELFKEAGAKYVVPVAEHHDGFSMYNSSVNKWNSTNMGPKRDIIGELKKSVTAKGLHFGLSSHRAENSWFFGQGMKFSSDVQDLSNTLYGQRLERPGKDGGMNPDPGIHPGSNEESREQWLQHTYELIDKYQPELIWFDWTVGLYPFQPTFYKFLAYYYNNAIDWKRQVVANTKFGFGDNIQVFDIERGKSDQIRQYAWQTDTSIGKKSWCYIDGEENKSPSHIVHDLVDIVSKNGNLLLNVGPKADGTITLEQQQVLKSIGKWLNINGEAIYGSRPWMKSGEGENTGTAGYMTDGKATNYTFSDIRFTTKGHTLYAITLAWPEETLIVKSLAKSNINDQTVKSVTLLGSNESLHWDQTMHGLSVAFPAIKPCEYAYTLKIEFE
jgi:alpha-L-fucosidase